jgi:hypothetical protein
MAPLEASNMASMKLSIPDEILEVLLLEGLNSGEAIPYTEDTMDEVRQRLRERLLYSGR